MKLVFFDETEIPNQEILYRRIPPQWMKRKDSRWEVSTGAFTTRQMSVHLASRISVEDVLTSYPTNSLISFTVKDIRGLGCILAKETDDSELSHFLVCPEGDLNQRISKAIARNLIKNIIWVKVTPPQSEP